MPGKLQVFEGYFTLHDSKRDCVSADRLGMRVMMFPKDETSETLQVEDLNQIFNNYMPRLEEVIAKKIDKPGKGYADCEELVQMVRD